MPMGRKDRRRSRQPQTGPAQQQQQQDGQAGGSSQILQAFYYGQALAITTKKRVDEFVLDCWSEVSKAAAERPTRLKEFRVRAGGGPVWQACSSPTLGRSVALAN